ncbi:cytosine deaminase [Thermanaerosceptrum fracticalcis]|uniref:Cytosine deaminase n=1 Tax=Thermanaerosceptrum fracticalcis TaxID=1712410 RepID=A0A7G6E596_THEFR|nr:cytosine deaminase [Thermanaerosceptrum fracticalcis]QNB47250.1 cytosine deaminase [Thermanaerosceptrum fracticalcis]
MDLIIRNAKLRKQKDPVDIGIREGKIAAVETKIEAQGTKEIDVGGKLVTPPFIDPHLHLDAVLSVGDPRYNMSGTLLEGIQIWGERKPGLTKEIIKKNAIEAIKWEVANGTLKIRTHADVCDPRLITVEALLEVKEEVKEIADLQVVAFPQDGVYAYKNGDKLMEEALKMGADVVGGIPHNELTREDGVKSIEYVFELAKKYDRLIDVHCDETGDDQSRFIEVMAKYTIINEMQGLVTASHTTSMHNFNNDYAFKLIGILKRAEMNMITNPFDNSVLQNRTDGYPRRRGHTRVDEMSARGVNVSIGHDSIMDPWYPLGKGSMLQAANLLLHMAHLSGYDQIYQLYDMITDNSAKTLNIQEKYGIEAGKPADMIVLNASDEMDAIRLMSECLYVIKNGRIVASTQPAKSEVTLHGVCEHIDFLIKK